MTPDELFDHRLAALLGRTVEEMRASLTHRAYLKWREYWEEEPWGPYRDNMHTALLAREIRRPQVRDGVSIKLDDFMLRKPETRARERNAGMLQFLRGVSKKTRRSD